MIYLTSKKHQSKFSVMLLLFLAVTLNGCSGVQTVTKKVYPDKLWVMPTEIGIRKDMLKTYGDVLNIAFPASIKAVNDCNADKKSIRNWMKEPENN